jgi:hypothetical protein
MTKKQRKILVRMIVKGEAMIASIDGKLVPVSLV